MKYQIWVWGKMEYEFTTLDEGKQWMLHNSPHMYHDEINRCTRIFIDTHDADWDNDTYDNALNWIAVRIENCSIKRIH